MSLFFCFWWFGLIKIYKQYNDAVDKLILTKDIQNHIAPVFIITNCTMVKKIVISHSIVPIWGWYIGKANHRGTCNQHLLNNWILLNVNCHLLKNVNPLYIPGQHNNHDNYTDAWLWCMMGEIFDWQILKVLSNQWTEDFNLIILKIVVVEIELAVEQTIPILTRNILISYFILYNVYIQHPNQMKHNLVQRPQFKVKFK